MEQPLLIKKFESESHMMKDYSQNTTISDYIEFETESPINFYCIELIKYNHNIYIKSDDPSELEVVMGNSCLGILVDHYFIYFDIQTFHNQIYDLNVYGLGIFYNVLNNCFYCISQTGFFRYDIKNNDVIYKDVGDFILEWKWSDRKNYIVKYSFDSLEFYYFNFLTMT